MPDRWHCVAFDLDGTLVDSLPALRAAYEDFLAEFGVRGSDAEFDRINGPTMSVIVDMLRCCHNLPGSHQELLARYYERVSGAYRTGVRPADGAEELLEHIAGRGWSRALVTSTPRRAVVRVIERFAWSDTFDVVVCGDDVTHAKPDPAVYQRACELGGWQPPECVAIEDAPAGVVAAATCGMSVIGIGSPERFEKLRQAGAGWTCATLRHVRETIEQLVAGNGG